MGRLATGALTTALTLSGFVATAGVAGAAGAPLPGPGGLQPITSYSDYPGALPAGCPGGADALVNVRFANGRGNTEADLRRLPVQAGDTIVMSWDDFAPGCKAADGTPAISVSLATYHNKTLNFDPSVDEELLGGWDACGSTGPTCEKSGGSYQLRITVPRPAGVSPECFLQIDAVLGLPLAVVGPHGSFYNNVIRGDAKPSMIVSATNFSTTCEETQPVETPRPTRVPELPNPKPVEVTPEVTTVVTQPPATTVTTLPTVTTTTKPEIPTEVEAETISRPRPTLPETGANATTGWLAVLGASLCAVGATLRRTARRFAL